MSSSSLSNEVPLSLPFFVASLQRVHGWLTSLCFTAVSWHSLTLVGPSTCLDTLPAG